MCCQGNKKTTKRTLWFLVPFHLEGMLKEKDTNRVSGCAADEQVLTTKEHKNITCDFPKDKKKVVLKHYVSHKYLFDKGFTAY